MLVMILIEAIVSLATASVVIDPEPHLLFSVIHRYLDGDFIDRVLSILANVLEGYAIQGEEEAVFRSFFFLEEGSMCYRGKE